MNHLFKRTLSLLLALAMVFSMVPGAGLHVHAEELEEHLHATDAAMELVETEPTETPASTVETETEAPVETTEAPIETEPPVETEAEVEETEAPVIPEPTQTEAPQETEEVLDEPTEATEEILHASADVALAATTGSLAGLSVDGLTAAYKYDNTNGGSASWKAGNDGKSITGSATGYKFMGFISNSLSTTLTLTNAKSGEAELAFKYTLNGGSVKASVGTMSNGEFSATLAAGASVTITLTSPKGASTATLTINGLSLTSTSTEAVNVTFKPAQGGTYTVDGTILTSETVKTGTGATEYALVATPTSGHKLAGWYRETADGGKYFTTSTTYEGPIDVDCTVYPVFVSSTTPIFQVGTGNYFFDLDDAVAFAQAGSDTQITLISSGTISDSTYEIPDGYTLLIPHSANYTPKGNRPETTGSTSWPTPSAYVTLTVASGTTLTVNGNLEVGGVLRYCSGGNAYGNNTYGTYGAVYMNSSSKIVVNGDLFSWGYVYGKGSVTANSGAKIYEPMQINDFYGGSNLGDMKHMFPFSQYYMQNIEVPLTLNDGANEYVYVKLVVSNYEIPADLPFIGSHQDAMFKLGSGSTVTKTYDPSKDRLTLDIRGDSDLKNVSLAPDLSGFDGATKTAINAILKSMLGGTTINSGNYILCLNGNMTINVLSGTTTVSQETSALPGTVLTVAEGATLKIASGDSSKTTQTGGSAGKNVYLYDAEQWGNYVFATGGGKKLIAAQYSPTANRYKRTEKDLTDVVVDINGAVVTDGFAYTTVNYDYAFDDNGELLYMEISGGGASIISSKGTGKVFMNNGAGTEMAVYNLDGAGASEITVFAASAQLKNGDGTYLDTTGAEPGTQYDYCSTHDCWYTGECKECSATPATVEVTWSFNGASVTVGEQTFQNSYTAEVAYNTTPTFFTDSPEKASDATNHYNFAGWSTTENGTAVSNLPAVTESTTFYAVFNATAHNGTDDGNCTTAVTCSCGYVQVAAKTHVDGDDKNHVCDNAGCTVDNVDGGHTPAEDDGNCETAILCTECDAVTTAAKTHVDGDDKNHVCDNAGCTVDNVDGGHTPAEDDGDCTTAILCTECDAVTTAAKTHVDGDDKNHVCDNAGCTVDNVDGGHTPAEDDGDCTTAILCTECDAVTTAAKTHVDGDDKNHACDNAGCNKPDVTTCVEGDPYYTDADDSGKHVKVVDCSVCGENISETTESHNYTTGDEPHTCACGVVETFTVTYTLNGGNWGGWTDDWEYTFEYGWKLIPDDGSGVSDVGESFWFEGINMYGYDFAGWLASTDGKTYDPGKDTYTLTGDVTFTAQWTCLHETTEAVDNGNVTHNIVCANPECNGYVVEANVPHDYTTGTAPHTCVCGAVETFDVSVQHDFFGAAIESGKVATFGQELKVVLKNNLSQAVKDVSVATVKVAGSFLRENAWSYDKETRTVTIDANSVYGDVVIDARALVQFSFDLNGGAVAEAYQNAFAVSGDAATRIVSVTDDIPQSEFQNWFVKEGHSAALQKDGKDVSNLSAADGDAEYTVVWTCLHQNPKAVPNEDGKTHNIVCDCGEIIAENQPHDFNNDAHTCACGDVETFTVTLADGVEYVEIVGEPVATYGEDLTIVLKNTLPDNITTNTGVEVDNVDIANEDFEEYSYDETTNTLTIPREFVTGDVEIDADALVTVTLDLKGGVLTVPEEMEGQFTLEQMEAMLEQMVGPIVDGKATFSWSYQDKFDNAEIFEMAYTKEGHTFAGINGTKDAIIIDGDKDLELTWEVNKYTLTVNKAYIPGPDTVELQVAYGANLLETLAKAAEEGKLAAIGDRFPLDEEYGLGENVVIDYINTEDRAPVTENTTMPANSVEIFLQCKSVGWMYCYDMDNYVGAEYYHPEFDYDDMDGNYLSEPGWHFIEENYDGVEGGAWYYFQRGTGDWADYNFRVEGLTRATYPTETINGNTYAPDQEAIDYAASKGKTFIDAGEAWFLFDEDGKFQSDYTGTTWLPEKEAASWAVNGMLPWHYGMVEKDGEYNYFIGDEEFGGNKLATGDVYVQRNNTDRSFVIGGIYTFDTYGVLCEHDGIVNMDDGTKRYYEDAQLMAGNGLTEVEDGYIFVRGNGELVVGAEYWVPANTLGVVPGMYEFDEEGYLINPVSTEKNGIYEEAGDYYFYKDGVITYAGLVYGTFTWHLDEGTAEYTGYIYVRTDGRLATGKYWVTSVNETGLTQGFYTFSDIGLMADLKDGFVSENGSLYYYVANKLQYNAGVIELNGNYYYVRSNGEVVHGRSYWITNVGQSGVVAKLYDFDENGVMQNPDFVSESGIKDGYYYVNGNKAYGAGIVKLSDENGEFYIYVRSDGSLATGEYWPTTTNGYDLEGMQNFGESGKLYIPVH